MAVQSTRFEDMTTKPVAGLVVRLAVPAIAIMLISALYNLADTFFVSSLGESATAAVGVSFSLMAVIQAIGFFFGHGSGNYISRMLGAQKEGIASNIAATGFFTAFGLSVLLSVSGLIFLEPLVLLLGATATNLAYAMSYVRWILIGMPFMVSSLSLNNLLRFQGSAVYGMFGMVSGAVINIGLDPLLIFVFHMEVGGAALATIISQTIGFLILLAGCQTGGNVHIRLSSYRFDPKMYLEILKGGAPSLFRQGLMAVATIFINRAAGAWGDTVIASISIVNRVTMFASSAMIGFGQGFQPVCGFNYGAGKYSRVRKAFWFSTAVMTSILTVLGIVFLIFSPYIIGLFAKGQDGVIDIGKVSLRLQSLSYPLLGWTIMCNMMTQTMGKAISASFMAMARQGLFLIPLALLLPGMLGILGIQLCLPLADLLGFLVSIPITVRVLRELGGPDSSPVPDGKRIGDLPEGQEA